jgi:hypothetical protein
MYHPREVSLSFSKLQNLGFIVAAEGNYSRKWEEREWETSWTDVENFGDSLKLLPIIAVMPFSRYAGIQSMRESGELAEWIASMSQRRVRTLANMMTVVRRHPYDGYQWNGVLIESVNGPFSKTTEPSWTGKNWQFGSADEAIEAANKALRDNNQQTEWYYISV